MPEDPRIRVARTTIRKAKLYNLYDWCNRLASWSLKAFCISVSLFLTGAWLAGTRSEFCGAILAIPAAVVGVISAVAYPWLLTFRDAIASGHRPWRYSLRTLLIATTLIAVVLGIIVWMTRAD